MSEDYLRNSLIAYKTGTRIQQEMSVIASMLDEETMGFMARTLSTLEAPPGGTERPLHRKPVQGICGRRPSNGPISRHAAHRRRLDG